MKSELFRSILAVDSVALIVNGVEHQISIEDQYAGVASYGNGSFIFFSDIELTAAEANFDVDPANGSEQWTTTGFTYGENANIISLCGTLREADYFSSLIREGYRDEDEEDPLDLAKEVLNMTEEELDEYVACLPFMLYMDIEKIRERENLPEDADLDNVIITFKYDNKKYDLSGAFLLQQHSTPENFFDPDGGGWRVPDDSLNGWGDTALLSVYEDRGECTWNVPITNLYDWKIYTLCLQSELQKNVEEPEEPTTGETWVINEEPISDIGVTVVSFVSNNERFNRISCSVSQGVGGSINFDYNQVYLIYRTFTEWTDQAYRTVTFETAPTGALLTWLQANAVKQEPSPQLSTPTLVLSDNTLQIDNIDQNATAIEIWKNGALFDTISVEPINKLLYIDENGYCGEDELKPSEVKIVLWGDRNTLDSEELNAFEAAYACLIDAVPEGFAARAFFWLKAPEGAESIYLSTTQFDMSNVTEIVAKYFEENEWTDCNTYFDGYDDYFTLKLDKYYPNNPYAIFLK